MDELTRKKSLTVPPGRIRLVIDSDAKNEIDDQFAIAWALRSPERFQVEAVYAAPFSHTVFQHNLGNMDYPVVELPDVGMEQSYQEICKIFDLLGQDREVREYFEENGADTAGMSKEELLSQAEVFALPDGKYLIVEG